MFKRGGSSYQSQGTGITSPYDTPRRGLVQQPGGYAGTLPTWADWEAKTRETTKIQEEILVMLLKGFLL